MNNSTPWKPTLLWHAKVFGALLACCLGAYFVLTYATAQLPPPYQQRHPAPETTQWLNR